MSDHPNPQHCPDCSAVTRRGFVKTAAAGVAASAAIGAGIILPHTLARGDKRPAASGETLVQQFYGSLNDEQKKKMLFPFDHALRHEIDNNWFITDAHIAKTFNKDQQALILDIFKSLHSEEYIDTVLKQVEHDNRGAGGFDDCSVALFGQPGSGKFEFVLTGRHVTRRCDGDSTEGAAFGGPIFYGHAAQAFNEKPDHPGNVYWYQAKRANEVFNMLDDKQRKAALLNTSRGENGADTVKLDDQSRTLAGLPVSELSKDQKAHVRKVMDDVLAPFRKADRDETMKLIEANQGFDKLHLSFYKGEDIGDDGVWDVWQIEGPQMIWYFRGKPHVHTWVHVKQSV